MSETQEESTSGRSGRARSASPRATAVTPEKRRGAAKPQPPVEAEMVIPQQSPTEPCGRDRMIAEAAYFRAERRGFSGDEADRQQDWLEAEAEVERMIAGATGSGNGK